MGTGAEIQAAATIAAALVGGMQARSAGKAAQAAADLDAQQYQLDALIAETQGKEQALAIRKQAWTTELGNVARVSKSYDPYTSMSWLAIEEDNEEEEELAINSAVLNSQLDGERFLYNAKQAGMAGRAARTDALLSGGQYLLKGGYQAYKVGSRTDDGSLDSPITGPSVEGVPDTFIS